MPRCAVILLLCLYAARAFAQDNQPVLISYTSAKGLSSNEVNNVGSDRQGFLWIATNYGLNKFDGNNFTHYYSSKSNQGNHILGNNVKKVLCDSIVVWTAIDKRGVSCYYRHAECFVNYMHDPADQRSLVSDNVNCFYLSADKRIFIGTDKGMSISDRRASGFTNLMDHPVTKNKLDINCFIESADGNIWIGTKQQGLLYYKANSIHVISGIPASLSDATVNGLFYNEATHELWVATNTGLWCGKQLSDHDFAWKQPFDLLNNTDVQCLEKNEDDIWIGTKADGLYKLNNKGKLVHYLANPSSSNGLLSNSIKDIFPGRDNGMWIATTKGLQYYRPEMQRFPVFKIDGPMQNIPAGLCAWNNWLVTATDHGVQVSDTDLVRKVFLAAVDDKKKPVSFYNTAVIGDELFIAGSNGLYQLLIRNGKPVLVKPVGILQAFNKTVDRPCIDLIAVNENIFWLSSADSIVYSFNRSTGKVAMIVPGGNNIRTAESRFITKLYKDRSGRIIIGTRDGLLIVNADGIQLAASKNINNTGNLYVNDIYDDGTHIWIATDAKGIYKCDRNLNITKQYNTDNGLCSNAVSCILPGNKNMIWFSTKAGLSVLNTISEKISGYYNRDGLESQEFCLYGKAAMVSGTLFFSTTAGVVKLQPSEWKNELPHRLAISISRVKKDTVTLAANDMEILNDLKKYSAQYNESISVSFSVLSFYNRNADTLQYKLNDKSNWINIASDAEILFQGLRPAVYHLYMRMKKGDNYFYGEQRVFTLEITAVWYQQWWFTLLSIAMLIAIVYFISRIRVRQKLKIFEVRDRISRDLHDEVGATLSGLYMYSHLTKTQVQANQLDAVHRSLDIMQDSAGSMVNKINDIVWFVNPKYDSLELLVQKLVDYATEMAVAANMKVQVQIPPEMSVLKLRMDQRRNLYLLCKEAVNNAVKYSNASLLAFTGEATGSLKKFIIRDNGTGFDMQRIEKGNGLSNMQKRAKDMDAQLQIDSVPGQGTVVTIKFKIT